VLTLPWVTQVRREHVPAVEPGRPQVGSGHPGDQPLGSRVVQGGGGHHLPVLLPHHLVPVEVLDPLSLALREVQGPLVLDGHLRDLVGQVRHAQPAAADVPDRDLVRERREPGGVQPKSGPALGR
jgi:hypothetical protein